MHGYLSVPKEWEQIESRRIGVFVTSETLPPARRPGGQVGLAHPPQASVVEFVGLDLVGAARSGGGSPSCSSSDRHASSSGPAPGYLAWVGFRADAITFFVGSIFFTAPRCCSTSRSPAAPDRRPERQRLRPTSDSRHRTVSHRLVGRGGATRRDVLLQRDDIRGIEHESRRGQAQHRIWTPDVLGSICFLVASELAFAEVGHRLVSWYRTTGRGGSRRSTCSVPLAFGVSAIASFVLPTTGEPASLLLTNLGTFVGAICFLVGAVLLLPERTHPEPNSVEEPLSH